MSLIEQQKQIRTLLVGTWCAEADNVLLIFDFSDNLSDQFPLRKLVSGHPPIESFYEIGSFPDAADKNKLQFYLTIGYSPKNKFLITKLTGSELVLRTIVNVNEIGIEEIKYIRKADIEFANELLKNMNLNW